MDRDRLRRGDDVPTAPRVRGVGDPLATGDDRVQRQWLSRGVPGPIRRPFATGRKSAPRRVGNGDPGDHVRSDSVRPTTGARVVTDHRGRPHPDREYTTTSAATTGYTKAVIGVPARPNRDAPGDVVGNDRLRRLDPYRVIPRRCSSLEGVIGSTIAGRVQS